MEHILYGKPILHSVLTLRTLTQNFHSYTETPQYSDDDKDQLEEVLHTIDLLKGSLGQIELAKSSLQALIDKIKHDYDNSKNKEDRKNIQQHLENIEKETNFTEAMKNATELSLMLGTRLTEAQSNQKRLARKLGLSYRAQENENAVNVRYEPDTHDTLITAAKNDLGSSSNRESNSLAAPTLPPPRVELPKFYGSAEEFPEFWTMYETLVHNNSRLTVIEKMMLLKDSLKGKSDRAIKGIQLVPQNYDWMIASLKKKYESKAANRSRIVQQLVNLPQSDQSAESNELVYDKICTLLNQMTCTGQDIRQTNDAMWTEAILQKFPRDIVEPVLLEMRDKEDLVIERVMDIIEKEISAKSYIQSRTRPQHSRESRKTLERIAIKPPQKCAICERIGHYAWQCRSPMTIAERRKIVIQKRLCWKCYSDQHSSKQCAKNDCPLCGNLHHAKLCYEREPRGERTSESQSTSQQYRLNGGRQQNQQRNNSSTGIGNTNNAYRSSERMNQYVDSKSDRSNATNLPRGRIQNHTHLSDDLTAESTENHATIEDDSKSRRNEQIVLMTAVGDIWNHNTEQFEKAMFFFDTGAQKTIIQEDFAHELGVPMLRTERCVMSGIGGKVETFESNVVHVKIGTAYGKDLEILIQTKPVLTNGFPAVKLCAIDQDFLQERNILVCNPHIRGEVHKPQIIVGLDYYYNFVLENGDNCRTPSGLRMATTIFGPTVYGRGLLESQNDVCMTMVTHGMPAIDETEHELLSKLFELEGLGISPKEDTNNLQLAEYYQNYSKQISFENGVVTAPFPLAPNVADIADNYSLAIKRLISLHRKLECNPIQKHWYWKIMQQYENDDIIERVTGDMCNSAGTYYMPHSGVWREHKPKPLRIVFDASSKRKGELSLNDVTLKGESLVNKIHDILVASRVSNIIVLCDIEAAFTQIRLYEPHRDLCRFLWLKDQDKPPTRDNIAEYRFKRVPFGVKPSPSILNMSLLTFLRSKNTPLAVEILTNLYVDNILFCASDPDEAVAKYKESKQLFSEIGMNLREYVSNCDEVNKRIPVEDRIPNNTIKLLGVKYDTKTDRFHITLKFPDKRHLSKKDIVSQLNSVYDPIGIASPLTVRLKHHMREIYDCGLDWTQLIPEQQTKQWTDICKELNDVSISVPRYVGDLQSPSANTTLWVFADASSKALAACAFIRHEGTREISPLISGKTRLTPKKIRQTIPRLEMVAIVMAMRLARTITQAIKKRFQQISILNDSVIALSWLKSPKTLPTFIKNQKDRIMKIRDTLQAESEKICFFHVPTEDNAADAGTRGVHAGQLSNLPWIYGPTWLGEDEVPQRLTPLSEIHGAEPEENEQEAECTRESSSIVLSAIGHSELIDLSRYSRLNMVTRVIARVCKTLRKWIYYVDSKKVRQPRVLTSKIGKFSLQWEITAEDIILSETILLSEVHRHASVEQLKKRFPQKTIFRDDHGIIRNASRLQNALLPYDAKNPIFVEKDSDLSRLILTDIHEKNLHCGKDHTLCIARQRFWIPRPSSSFNKFIRHCVTCKKAQGLPFGAPAMPPLPKDRVVLTRPFQTTGCDFMGPFLSKENTKSYICLYTCLTTRALHLEVVEDMSAGAFLNSFIRFISRRGVPKLIRTDCGTNFRLGQRIIELMFEHENRTGESVMSYSANQRIQWIFNPPGAPWMGGAWERLVGSVKRAFTKAVGKRKLSQAELYTIVTQIEAILNTRPLTALNSSQIEEIPIRPIDFLQSSLKYNLTAFDSQELSDPSFDPALIQTVDQAKQALRHVEMVTEKFWGKWHTEYLTGLREIQAVNRKQPRHSKLREPQANEIVLVEQENLPRGSWCYGKIIELVRSADGLVRSVKLLMPNKHIWHRPVNKIYPLEISSTSEESSDSDEKQGRESPAEDQHNEINGNEKRPQRAAKLKAIKTIEETKQYLEDSPTFHSISALTNMMVVAAIVLLFVHPANAINPLTCDEHQIRVKPPSNNFELCIRSTCRTFTNASDELVFQLPYTSQYGSITISIRYFAELLHHQKFNRITCVLPNICTASRTLLSKTLLGNPHCWPTGAIISLATLIYIFAATIALALKASLRKTKKSKRQNRLEGAMLFRTPDNDEAPVKNRASDAANSERGNETHIQLATFNPQPLSRTTAIAVAITVCSFAVLENARACQYGYTRHNVEIICNSHDKCMFEFNREILFNELTNMVCISLMQSNKSIGTILIEQLPVELYCSKRTLFFTRDTDYTVFSAVRCADMGSCTTEACSKVEPHSVIDELKNASEYPGYSGCEPSCGGLLCGCLLPLPSCSFYRVANIPRSQVVYEIVECMDWRPLVRIRVHISIRNKKTSKVLALLPYKKEKIGNTTITVISLSKPTNPLLQRRYAIAPIEILTIPEGYQLPVECSTAKEAQDRFDQCRNKLICSCDVEVSPAKCNCPNDSIKNIRADISNVIPISSPFIKLLRKGTSLAALSSKEEMVLALESTYIRDSAEFVVEQNCSISLAPLTGCYNCQEGATVTAFCYTKIHSWVIVHCEDHTFSIECDETNRTTLLTLDFQKAVINLECRVECNKHSQKIPLQGTLAFLPRVSEEQLFGSHTSSWSSSSSWLEDWSIPDLVPVINTIKSHWKISLAVFGTGAAIAVATYFLGPALLLTIIQSAPKLLKFLLKTLILTFHIIGIVVKLAITWFKALSLYSRRREID